MTKYDKLAKDIEDYITEATVSLGNEEYAEVLREVAQWCENRAEIAEYIPDFESEEDE